MNLILLHLTVQIWQYSYIVITIIKRYLNSTSINTFLISSHIYTPCRDSQIPQPYNCANLHCIYIQAHRKQLQIGGAHINFFTDWGGAHINFLKMTDLCNEQYSIFVQIIGGGGGGGGGGARPPHAPPIPPALTLSKLIYIQPRSRIHVMVTRSSYATLYLSEWYDNGK